jgi:hypothetical protein
MTIKDGTLSDLESLLLTTPAITVLNQVEVELGLAGLSTSSNVQVLSTYQSSNANLPRWGTNPPSHGLRRIRRVIF